LISIDTILVVVVVVILLLGAVVVVINTPPVVVNVVIVNVAVVNVVNRATTGTTGIHIDTIITTQGQQQGQAVAAVVPPLNWIAAKRMQGIGGIRGIQ